jgi:hypothetical protein
MGNRPCLCCGCLTLDRRGLISLDWVNFGSFENCPVCGWEDDPAAYGDKSVRTSNGISLIEGRENYNRLGACLEELRLNVRPPRPDETPAESQATER